MVLKFCNTCSKEKTAQDFPKHKEKKDGLASNCKECCRSRAKQYREANPEKARAIVKKCLDESREKYNEQKKEYCKKYSKEAVARAKKWNEENPDSLKECRLNWKRNNKHKVNTDTAKRRAKLINATPEWLTEDHIDVIGWIYEEACRKSDFFGIAFHVDHIVPLNSKIVCGLHVPWNLQLITAAANVKKSNKLLEVA